MNTEKSRAHGVVAGAVGVVLGILVMLWVNDIFWWVGGIVGGVSVATIWMYKEIAYAVPIAAKEAAKSKMYVLIVARAFLAALQSPVLLTRRIKRLTIVGKYQLAAISIGVLQYWACVVLSSVFLENVLWGAMGFVVYTIPLTGVAKPATTKWYWYLEGGEVKEEEDEEYARHARRGIISMLAFLTPSLALFLWKSARAMLRAIPELVRFVKEFIATLWRLLCTQALVRSTTTGILGVVIAKFLFVEMMELRAAPTIVLGLLIGGLLGYFLPEPERQIVQQ